MKISALLVSSTAAALLLAACNPSEADVSDEPENVAPDEASSSGSGGESAAKTSEVAGDEASQDEKSEKSEDTVKADETGKPAAGKTWVCEGQGDVDVTFAQKDDGTATLTYEIANEAGAGEAPIVTKLEATGASAGDEGRHGRMAAEDGDAIVWFLKDGNVEVTEGEGEYRNSYVCSPAG